MLTRILDTSSMLRLNCKSADVVCLMRLTWNLHARFSPESSLSQAAVCVQLGDDYDACSPWLLRGICVMEEIGKAVLIGRTGSGKSTLANMLVKGSLDPPHPAPMGNGLRGTTAKCKTYQGRGWTVVDTMGFGEPDTGTVPDEQARKLVIDFLKGVRGCYSHIIFVQEKGRCDIVSTIIWKTFVEIFKGAEKNFVALYTKTDEDWLDGELANIKQEFPECDHFLCVDFPPIDEDSEMEELLREERESELVRLEGQLKPMFETWVSPDIFKMGNDEIEEKAESILRYIARLIKSLVKKYEVPTPSSSALLN